MQSSAIRNLNNSVLTVLLLVFLMLAGCGEEPPENEDAAADIPEDVTQEEQEMLESMGEPTSEEVFWSKLHEHCGLAFEGELAEAAEGFDLLDGSETIIVHFRSCTDFETRLPFHIETATGEWDRSRTWVFFNHGDDELELRHDHRHEDGSEEEETWYGGDAVEGEGNWQRFIYPPRTEEVGKFMGWRVEIHPHERFTYGTMRGNEWTFRVDFDLTTPVEAPPPPWGF